MAIHTLICLWRATLDPLFAEMNWQDKNIIKWSVLLHDIRKLSKPTIEGKDHVHPFKSASSVLDVLRALNIIKVDLGSPKENAFIQANRLLAESVQPVG